MSKRWALRLLLAVMLLAAFSAAASADEGDGWYDASQEEYFWQDQQEVVFPDVTPEHWSYDDVMYLYRNGIIGGFPDGTFRPDEPVTRGQLAVMLARFAALLELRRAGAAEPFADAAAIPDWAADAAGVCRGLGLLSGDEQGRFAAEEMATRAQCAVIAGRLAEKALAEV